MIRHVVYAAAVASVLAGCALQMVEASRATCSSYGYQPGTEAFADCVQQEQGIHTIVLRPTDTPDVQIPQAP